LSFIETDFQLVTNKKYLNKLTEILLQWLVVYANISLDKQINRNMKGNVIMKAIEFFNELQKDKPIYDSGMATIKEIGTKDEKYYVIHRDGTISQNNPYDRINSLEELTGEYEYYSPVQYAKCGYIEFKDVNSYEQIKEIISSLHDKFNSEEYNNELNRDEKHYICGGSYWHNGLTDSFEYYAPNDIEIEIKTIPVLCKYNNLYRKKINKKCLPFNKDMLKENSIYVSVVVNVESKKYTKENIELAIKDLLMQFPSYEIKWTDMSLKQNIYL
jgi:hypothetical protein